MDGLVVGKRYWYRWSMDFEACSGLLIGLSDDKALFEDESKGNKCRVVDVRHVHCEDTRLVTIKKPSFFRMW